MKLKYKNIIKIIFILIFLGLFIYSFLHIVEWKSNNHKNKKINEILHEYITLDNDEKYHIDFNSLKEINNEAVAYIKINNTNIDYVVVKTKDNDYYLNHNFEKKYNKSGWIFVDYKNNLDEEDKNIVLYGHNTMDKSMFGSLKDTLKEDWYTNKDNYTVIFATESNIYKYEVFSNYKIDNEEYYITTSFINDGEYLKFLNTLKKRSVYDYGVELNKEDKIITLSTCANNGKKRVVLHARLVDKENKEGEINNEER